MNEPDDTLWDGKGSDPEVERLQKLLAPLAYDPARHRVPEAPPVPAPANRPWRAVALATLLAAAAVVAFAVHSLPPKHPVAPSTEVSPETDEIPELHAALVGDPSDWGVEVLDGMPVCGGVAREENFDLVPGLWLETDADSRARLNLADLGVMDVDPGTRIRLVRSDGSEHRLELAQGRVSAVVSAPPRFLVVETPTVTAVDMGCAYTLEVTPAGDSVLDVTSGWVWLEAPDHTSMVPAGARAISRKGTGPGTPWFVDADPQWAAALAQVDAGGGDLATVLSGARARDTLSLAHLVATVPPPQRAAVWTRLEELAPIDPDLRDAALAGDHDALKAVLDETRARW